MRQPKKPAYIEITLQQAIDLVNADISDKRYKVFSHTEYPWGWTMDWLPQDSEDAKKISTQGQMYLVHKSGYMDRYFSIENKMKYRKKRDIFKFFVSEAERRVTPVHELLWKEMENLYVLDYYPYGPKTQFTSWLTGTVDLREEYKRRPEKTIQDYSASIIHKVGKALHYVSALRAGDDWDFDQRITTFCFWELMGYGIRGWTKKPLKGLSDKEKAKLYKIHEQRYDRLYSKNDYASEEDKVYQKKFRESKTPEQLESYLKFEKEHTENNRKKYGIYEVKHFPVYPAYDSKGAPFYTLQELAAIDLLVSMEFENMC